MSNYLSEGRSKERAWSVWIACAVIAGFWIGVSLTVWWLA